MRLFWYFLPFNITLWKSSPSNESVPFCLLNFCPYFQSRTEYFDYTSCLAGCWWCSETWLLLSEIATVSEITNSSLSNFQKFPWQYKSLLALMIMTTATPVIFKPFSVGLTDKPLHLVYEHICKHKFLLLHYFVPLGTVA